MSIEALVILSKTDESGNMGGRFMKKTNSAVSTQSFERNERISRTTPISFSGLDLGATTTNVFKTRTDAVGKTYERRTTTKLRRIQSSSISSTREWGMDHYRHRTSFLEDDSSRRRGTDSKLQGHFQTSISQRLSPICLFEKSNIWNIDINRPTDHYKRLTSSNKRTPRRTVSSYTTTHLFATLVCVLLCLADFCPVGHAFSSSCTVDECATDFSRTLDRDGISIGPNLPYCTLLINYGSCLNRTSRSCRGNLKFHSLNTIVMTKIREDNCTALVAYQRRLATAKPTAVGKPSKPNMTTTTTDDGTGNNDGNSPINNGRCQFPYQHQKGTGGYRYCNMFGDPHLRTFEGQYETCRTLGAWPLIDNSYFGVQVTSEPVADGVDASGISKVTVIVKSSPGCTDQKTFDATGESLPSTFVDGTTTSGDPNKNTVGNMGYYYTASSDDRRWNDGNENRPAVIIRMLESDRHVEIHLRHISTRVVIRRFGNYLTVAIKIPDDIITQRTVSNTLQLCLTGCPSTERINYKEVLAYPEYYVKKWGARIPLMNRDEAMDICRNAGVTDFFFDSCVFDLLMTGDTSFKDSALAALDDIRQLYPPYKKHYETRRSDLNLYDDLAKLGRVLEFEEREHGHKRRQPVVSDWNFDQQHDEQSTVRSSDELFITSNSRTNSATVPLSRLPFLVCLIILAYFRRLESV